MGNKRVFVVIFMKLFLNNDYLITHFSCKEDTEIFPHLHFLHIYIHY